VGLADQGLPLLDEIGDIPVAMQPNLLCLLQEQGFERLSMAAAAKFHIDAIA
jgi:transcriptional regulator with GAF, ATPase, and Fis domain